jgi:hypothetical protein
MVFHLPLTAQVLCSLLMVFNVCVKLDLLDRHLCAIDFFYWNLVSVRLPVWRKKKRKHGGETASGTTLFQAVLFPHRSE